MTVARRLQVVEDAATGQPLAPLPAGAVEFRPSPGRRVVSYVPEGSPRCVTDLVTLAQIMHRLSDECLSSADKAESVRRAFLMGRSDGFQTAAVQLGELIASWGATQWPDMSSHKGTILAMGGMLLLLSDVETADRAAVAGMLETLARKLRT